jgi:signal transduction histidine kinase
MKTGSILRTPLTIRQRIYLGFLSICLILVLLAGVGLWGIWKIKAFSETFHQLNEQADLLIDIDRQTTAIQREAIRFMNEGRPSIGRKAIDGMSALRKELDQAVEKEGSDPDLEAILKRVRSHLVVYESTFEKAVQEKLLNDQLIRRELPSIAADLEARLTGLHGDFPDSCPLVPLLRARNYLYAYFTELDSRLAREAFSELDSLDAAILRLETGPPGQSLEEKRLARETLSFYRERASRAIQATRGYLYLINVVMSGEVSEIIYKTRHLRESGELRKTALESEMSAQIDRITLLILLISSLAVVGGTAYALVIARQITDPLTRITRTFLQLSEGKDVADIPGSHRGDEIGDLAQSANVFNRQNIRTRELLEQTNQLARELRDKSEALERSNSELEQFVYTVSHDLKSPIITSMGFITMIRDLAREGRTEEAFSKIDRLERANQRMGALVNDLLELSRVGRTEIETQRLDSGDLLHRLEDLMRPVLETGGFKLYLKGDFPDVEANESRFMEIFENLVSNALKYGAATDGQENRVEIDCQTFPGDGCHTFRVRDFGPGIPTEFQEKIFSLFARLDKAGEGTGIGLTITRKLARLYGGDVRAASPDGPGALFIVLFPIVQSEGQNGP